MKILILVLSADFSPYKEMIETSLSTWDSQQVDDMETVYYCGESDKQNTDKIIYLPIKDTMLRIGYKTLGAFEYALTKDFDYVARVHSSIYVDKIKLKEFIEKLPKNNIICGVKAMSQNGFGYLWGGLGFILSRDAIEEIVKNKNLWQHKYMEDESLSLIATDLHINTVDNYAGAIDKMPGGWRCISYTGESISFTDFVDLKKLNHHYYRVKCDGHRETDKFIMQELFKVL